MKKVQENMQKNKITSYFSCAGKIEPPIIKRCTKTISEKDDDCIIIDELDHQDVIEKVELITEVNTDNCHNHRVDNEDKKEPQSNNEEVFEDKNDNTISSDDDDFLCRSLEAIESQNDLTTISHNTEIDSPTVFFLCMLEEFLDKPYLHYLFDTSDIDLIRSFYNLPNVEHQKLFVRLYWLQWKWYKTSDTVLKYLKCDIKLSSSCQNIVKTMQERHFLLSGAQDMDFDDWTSVLLKPDLIKVCNHFKINTSNSDKATLIKQLKKFCSTKSSIFNFNSLGNKKSMEKNVLKMISDNFGDCIKITEIAKRVFDSLHLIMYLGMNPTIIREKKLNLLLMNVKNGKETFPAMDIKLDTLECVFPNKKYFDEYEEAYNLYEQIIKLTTSPPCNHEEVVKISKICDKNYKRLYDCEEKPWIPSVWLHRFTAGYCYIKAMELSIGSLKALKNDKSLHKALEILTTMLKQNNFRQHKRALWYNEKTLILQTRLREFEKAARVLVMALNQIDITNDAKAPLVERARRIALQKNIKLPPDLSKLLLDLTEEPEVNFPYLEISANSTDSNYPGKKSQYMFRDIITGDRVYSNVEQYALLHYIQNTEYNRGEHWEGRIINSIFILLFWDIIYSSLDSEKGVFLSRYQEAPLDIYTDKFYSNRESSIKSRISELESGWATVEDIIQFMEDIFTSRKDCEVSLFHSGIEWSQISEIAHCLGRNGLLCLCKRLSSMFYYAQSGFPDLTIWNAQTKKVKFVEVKGDGDRLSHKQIQWMNYLIQNGIDTEVCYVHKGSNVRKAARKRVQADSNNSLSKKKRSPVKVDVMENTEQTSGIRKSRKNETKDSPVRSQSSNSDELLKRTPTKTNIAHNEKSPSSSKSPYTECYLRSPTKYSKGGIGYFVSPKRESPNCRRKLSLSLTKRKIFERDT